MTDGPRWYVIQTKPNSETRAEINLRRQGFQTYLPRYRRNRRHARMTQSVIRPLFPRYMFVCLDLARDSWRSVQSTFGVSHLICGGEAPMPLPDSVMDEIRAREGQDGFVTLGLPAGVGPGSAIRLVEGIFENAVGVLEKVADNRRVTVLLKLLGREVRVLAPAMSVGTA